MVRTSTLYSSGLDNGTASGARSLTLVRVAVTVGVLCACDVPILASTRRSSGPSLSSAAGAQLSGEKGLEAAMQKLPPVGMRRSITPCQDLPK